MLSVDIAGGIGALDIKAAFDVASGVTALAGPSGAGKSTVLRAIAGLWTPREGTIVLGSRTLLNTADGTNVLPHQRRIGAVFQKALLFPHMSVERNLTYGMPADSGDFRKIVDLLDIGDLLKRMPRNLSGGESQRVALGRALLSKPDLLLLDEPMTGLDERRRDAVLPHLLSLHESVDIPVLYVTHRSDEVTRIAQKVVPMENGCSGDALSVEAYMDLSAKPAVDRG